MSLLLPRLPKLLSHLNMISWTSWAIWAAVRECSQKQAIHFYIFSVCMVRAAYEQKLKDFKIAAHAHQGVDGMSVILLIQFLRLCSTRLIWWFANVGANVVIHGTKWTSWDQVTLNNTNLKLRLLSLAVSFIAVIVAEKKERKNTTNPAAYTDSINFCM